MKALLALMAIGFSASFAVTLVIVSSPYSQAQACGDGTCSGDESPERCPADCQSQGPQPPQPSCGDGACNGDESPERCPQDCPVQAVQPACGNGICENTETPGSCPTDCGTQSSCGNGICDGGESPESCPADCRPQSQPSCGDGACNGGESLQSCPQDCPVQAVQPACGNAVCEPGESPESCPGDCRPQSQCPEQVTCPNGAVVACQQREGSCECRCPLPENCRETTDQNGYSHVTCEEQRTCPPIPREVFDRCREDGGEPKVRADRVCEYVECSFREEGSFLGGGSCPKERELETWADRCAESGLEPRKVFERGCRMVVCGKGGERVCEEEQSFRDRKSREENCRQQGLSPSREFDDRGCQITVCRGEGHCIRNLPEEAYRKCNKHGGELVAERGQSGCFEFIQCVQKGDPSRVQVEEVERVPDATQLLEVAFKMEELSRKLDELARKAGALADYYQSVGDPDEKRLRRVASMFEAAQGEVERIKTRLRQSLESLTIQDIEEFKQSLRTLKEVTLKDIVYVMLSSSEEAVSKYEREEEARPEDSFEFEKAFRTCEKASFRPEPSVLVELRGVDEGGRCILTARAEQGPPGISGEFSMECRIREFSLGMNVGEQGPGPETMDRWNCQGPMADAIRSGRFQGEGGGGPGGPGGCRSDQECDRYCRDNFEECQRWCRENPGICPEQPTSREAFGPGEFGGESGSGGPGPEEFSRGPGSGEECSGCLANGVCDPGECSGCPDCRRPG